MNEPVRPDDLRVSDAERNQIQDQLKRAHAAGQLDLNEFDDRVRSVWGARTRGELSLVTADLPALPEPPRPGARRPVFSDTGGGMAMRVLTIIWASISAVNLAVWAMISVTTGHFLPPWWAFVAIPPGTVLTVLYIAGVGRPRRER